MLKDAVGYNGSHAGFIQLLAAMAKDGEIQREVRGKRTYRVWLTRADTAVASGAASQALARTSTAERGEPAQAGLPLDEGVATHLDYEELAATLLARVARIIAEGGQPVDQSSWAKRRVERLETRNAVLERELARARGEAEMNRQERDSLQAQLEAAQHNLNLLTERLGGAETRPTPAANRLNADEQALLHRLSGDRRPTTRRPERAS